MVLLARRLRHDLNTRIQNFVPSDDQFGRSTAKQFGEHAAKVLVHRLEGVAQQLAGFPIDFAYRIFQCGDGFVQISGLRVKECFALTRGTQFFQSSQIHRAQGLRLTLKVINLIGQTRQLDRFLLDAGGDSL